VYIEGHGAEIGFREWKADEQKGVMKMSDDHSREEVTHIPVHIESIEQQDIWEAPQYYANYVEIHTASTDFRLSFYVRGPQTKEDQTVVEHRRAVAAIRLPIEMLGSVRAILNSQIELLEEKEVAEAEGDES